MKIRIESVTGLTKIIKDLKQLRFKREYGFETKYTSISYATYKVLGEPFYIRSMGFSKKITLITVKKHLSNPEEGYDLKKKADHTEFFNRSELFEDVEAIDVDYDHEILVLLEKLNLINLNDQIVQKYLNQLK